MAESRTWSPADLLASLPRRWARLWSRLWRADNVLWLLVLGVLLLPLMMASAVSSATVAQMKLQADEISTLASGIRAYYADNVIARLQAADGRAVYTENYRDVHGGIPIPATLSIELGALFDNAHSDGRISYDFLSDYPFAKRLSHPIDNFERQAIQAFRADPQLKTFTELKGVGLGNSSYRLATPVLMRQACVTCHNAHPDSPKRDWKVGDVRGIQEVTVRGLQVNGFGRLGILMGYAGFLGLTSVAATAVFRRRSLQLVRSNERLQEVNRRESSMAVNLADQIKELSIFGHVVDNSIVGITIADMRKPDCPLIYVNDAFTQITGYGRELAVGYNCRFLQGPDTDPAEIEKIRAAIQSGTSYTGELLNYRLDGSRFWNRLTLYPIFNGGDDRPDYFVGNQVDITVLKQHSGLLIDDLSTIQAAVSDAREALQQAERFGDSLRRHYQQSPASENVAEAYLLAEQSCHRQLDSALQSLLSILAAEARL